MNLFPNPSTLFIRPVHNKDGKGGVLSLALVSTNGEVLVDEQVLCHFEANTSGLDIKAEGKETFGASEVTWGNCLFV